MPSLPFYRHMGERSITPIEYWLLYGMQN
jgi:hypothetical protein